MAKIKAESRPALSPETKPLLEEYKALTDWLEKAKARELELRKYFAALFFPSPREGVNKIVTADGFEFALDHKVNRKLDESVLDHVMLELPEDSPYRQPGVLIQYKPALVMAGFRALSENEELAKIFAQALTETPGTPSLEINFVTPEVAAASDPATAPAVPDWPAAPGADPAFDGRSRKDQVIDDPVIPEVATKKRGGGKKKTAKAK